MVELCGGNWRIERQPCRREQPTGSHNAAFRYSMKLSTMTGEVTRTEAAAAGPGATLLYDDWHPGRMTDSGANGFRHFCRSPASWPAGDDRSIDYGEAYGWGPDHLI